MRDCAYEWQRGVYGRLLHVRSSRARLDSGTVALEAVRTTSRGHALGFLIGWAIMRAHLQPERCTSTMGARGEGA